MFKAFVLALLCTLCVNGVRGQARIDPDTKESALRTKRRNDGKDLPLVFSDEFSKADRSFAGDDDPFFSAVMKPDDTNMAIQFYNSSKEYVTTKDGNLVVGDLSYLQCLNGAIALVGWGVVGHWVVHCEALVLLYHPPHSFLEPYSHHTNNCLSIFTDYNEGCQDIMGGMGGFQHVQWQQGGDQELHLGHGAELEQGKSVTHLCDMKRLACFFSRWSEGA